MVFRIALITAAVLSASVLADDIDESFLQNRIDKQFKSTGEAKFALMPYRRNYLVYSYLMSGLNKTPYMENSPGTPIYGETQELQLQISIMVPVWDRMFDSEFSIYAAYTNRSFWQVFSDEHSQPFRETNHEPEIWLWYNYDLSFDSVELPMAWLGYNHQSNGKWEPLSRGWNRIFAQFFASYDVFDFTWKPWVVLGESEAFTGLDGQPKDDYTPYMGDGEFTFTYAYGHNNSVLKWNYSYAGLSYGSIMADLEIPITDYLSLYTRYFYGYGESLVDMDYRSNTISIGFCVNDWQ